MGIDLTQLIALWPINYCQDPRTLNAIQTTITALNNYVTMKIRVRGHRTGIERPKGREFEYGVDMSDGQ